MRRQSELNHANKIAKRAYVTEYKVKHGCSVCGEKHPACLSFHHRDGSTKDASISYLVSRYASYERIDAEMAKCDILCENCHRKHHWDAGDRGY